MCVDDRGNAVVVDVHGAAGHALHTDDALVFSLVGQHRPGDHVTDSINTERRNKEIMNVLDDTI